MFKLIAVSALFLVSAEFANAKTTGWRQIECRDGFKMSVHYNTDVVGVYDAAAVDNVKLKLANDNGSDSDKVFSNGNETAYISESILHFRIGRVNYGTKTNSTTHEDCELFESIEELRCKFFKNCK